MKGKKGELKAADRTEECDIVIVGLGTSGLTAAATAAQAGAKVVGIDRADFILGES